MEYSFSKDINLPFKLAENKVRSSLLEVGFGVLTEISINEAFRNKLDLEFKNYKILGACNPALAYEAINYEETIGILMPCNIIIIDNEDGTTKLVFPKAKKLLNITDNRDLLELSVKVDKLLETAFNNIN